MNKTASDLEDELTQVLVAETGLKPDMARYFIEPIVRHLAKQYGGDRLHIPAPRRHYPGQAIIEALAATGDRRAVCERFGISRSTLYRLLKASEISAKAKARL